LSVFDEFVWLIIFIFL